MDAKKVFVTAVLVAMAGILVSALDGMARDSIRVNVHMKEQDKRIDENHQRSMKIFGELRTIRKEMNDNHHQVLKEILQVHKNIK